MLAAAAQDDGNVDRFGPFMRAEIAGFCGQWPMLVGGAGVYSWTGLLGGRAETAPAIVSAG